MRYLVEAPGGGKSPFTYESETAPEVGEIIFDRREWRLSWVHRELRRAWT
jgi:hypothetical protein